jgi:hypothetical protein
MTAEEFRAAKAAEWDAKVGVFQPQVNSGETVVVYQTLRVRRFSGILMKDVDTTVFNPRHAPCHYIAQR